MTKVRSTDAPLGVCRHLEEADVAHSFKVRPHRVGVQLERFGDLGGRQRLRGPGQLQVDRVASVVAECLEQLEARSGHA